MCLVRRPGTAAVESRHSSGRGHAQPRSTPTTAARPSFRPSEASGGISPPRVRRLHLPFDVHRAAERGSRSFTEAVLCGSPCDLCVALCMLGRCLAALHHQRSRPDTGALEARHPSPSVMPTEPGEWRHLAAKGSASKPALRRTQSRRAWFTELHIGRSLWISV